MRKVFFVGVFVLLLVFAFFGAKNKKNLSVSPSSQTDQKQAGLDPLTVEAMRNRSYEGSDLQIEETLESGSDYSRYIASYVSDGLKIYGLLTVPNGEKPKNGWPAIVFNHGYIPPEQYRTTERYVAYVDGFARNGYVVFKPDFRGNGSSEGQPEGAYYSPAYTIDTLNALASLKKYPGVNSNKMGMWGHSLGGNITLRSLVVSQDIKAAVIWGGVVGTYNDLMNNWYRKVPYVPSERELSLRNRSRSNMITKYGTLDSNPDFWHSVDPNFNLQYVNAPVQLNAGLLDEEVPWQFSQGLKDRLEKAGKTVEYYTYPGSDHNISQGFNEAMQRSIEFFDKYLKN